MYICNVIIAIVFSSAFYATEHHIHTFCLRSAYVF